MSRHLVISRILLTTRHNLQFYNVYCSSEVHVGNNCPSRAINTSMQLYDTFFEKIMIFNNPGNHIPFMVYSVPQIANYANIIVLYVDSMDGTCIALEYIIVPSNIYSQLNYNIVFYVMNVTYLCYFYALRI